MKDVDLRLRRCFLTVFPDLKAEGLDGATQTSVEGWDSVAAITLLSVIEEEFATQIDLELLPELTSFTAIRDLLSSAPPSP